MITGFINNDKFIINDDDKVESRIPDLTDLLNNLIEYFKLTYPSYQFYWHNYLAYMLETQINAEIKEVKDKQELEDKGKNIIY